MVDEYEFQISCNTICDRYCFFVRKNMIEFEKEKQFQQNIKLELPHIIPLMPIVEGNHRLPMLHLSKIIVHINITEKIIHQFEIGYMIKPPLHISKIFREQVQNSWVVIFISKQ